MKVSLALLLFLGFSSLGYAEMPPDDLDRVPGLSDADKALMREARGNAKNNLINYQMGSLIGADQALKDCLVTCATQNEEKFCVEKCALMGETTGLNQAAINHNPGDVNCTGNHVH